MLKLSVPVFKKKPMRFIYEVSFLKSGKLEIIGEHYTQIITVILKSRRNFF